MSLELVSFNLCPFVQRSVITLEEKGVPYTIQYIDLADKPDWFTKISPFGKVPVLKVDDTVLFESAVINEYIDETSPPSLHPADPLLRAHNRAWIEFASALLGDVYRLMVAPDEAAAQKATDEAKAKLERLEQQVRGPFFNGERFSLVDAATAPALQRLTWCMEIAPKLDVFAATPRIRTWTEKLLARESVQRSTIPNIQDVFREYLQGRGSPARRAESSWLGTLVS